MYHLFMGQKIASQQLNTVVILLFLEVHVDLVIMTGGERMPRDSNGSLHCCIFKNVSGLNCLKFCSRGKNTTSGIISKWNDFDPRHYLSLQIPALGPSLQQAGRSLRVWMLNVSSALDRAVCVSVCAAVLSEVRVGSGAGLSSTAWALPASQGMPQIRMAIIPAQPAPLPFAAPSAMHAAKQEVNFFPYFIHLCSALVTILGLSTCSPPF